jgi:DNA-binding transcriptional LysR family regulator
MTLQQLQYFLATVEHGSFSAAAESLWMAQPSLSEQIRRLEAELGAPLFTRLGRGVALTEAGRALRPHAEETLAAAEAAAMAVAEVRELRGGTASFGTFGSAPHYLLGDLVADFRRRHPSVRVRVVGQNSAEVADSVRAGELEAGLVVLPIDDEGLDVRPAIQDEVLFTSADPAKTAEPMTIERFAELPLILYDARWGTMDPTRRQLAELAQRAGVKIEPTIEIEDPDAAMRLAARGLGDTIVARALADSRRFPRALGTVRFEPRLYDTFAFVQRRGARLSPATRELVGLAENRLTELGRRLAEAGTVAEPPPASRL